jgi:hypothetical protein
MTEFQGNNDIFGLTAEGKITGGIFPKPFSNVLAKTLVSKLNLPNDSMQ